MEMMTMRTNAKQMHCYWIRRNPKAMIERTVCANCQNAMHIRCSAVCSNVVWHPIQRECVCVCYMLASCFWLNLFLSYFACVAQQILQWVLCEQLRFFVNIIHCNTGNYLKLRVQVRLHYTRFVHTSKRYVHVYLSLVVFFLIPLLLPFVHLISHQSFAASVHSYSHVVCSTHIENAHLL